MKFVCASNLFLLLLLSFRPRAIDANEFSVRASAPPPGSAAARGGNGPRDETLDGPSAVDYRELYRLIDRVSEENKLLKRGLGALASKYESLERALDAASNAYATMAWVNDRGYATRAELAAARASTADVDAASYATKSALLDLERVVATKVDASYVDTKLLATKEELENKASREEMDAKATKDEVNEIRKLAAAQRDTTSLLSGRDLSEGRKKKIPRKRLAPKWLVKKLIASAKKDILSTLASSYATAQSVSGIYATKTELSDYAATAAGSYATIQSLASYATAAQLDAVASKLDSYATTDDLSNYATTDALKQDLFMYNTKHAEALIAGNTWQVFSELSLQQFLCWIYGEGCQANNVFASKNEIQQAICKWGVVYGSTFPKCTGIAKNVLAVLSTYGSIEQWQFGDTVTDFNNLFYLSDFNQDIGAWDVSRVVWFISMFASSAFNQDLSNWNVSSAVRMETMFYSSKFNQDISSWAFRTDGEQIYCDEMFHNATNFAQDLCKWNSYSLNGFRTFWDTNCTYNGENEDINAGYYCMSQEPCS